jgi:hypothetical protein
VDGVTSLGSCGGGAFAGEGGGGLAVLALVALEDLAHGVPISIRVADRTKPLEIFSCAGRSGLSSGPSLEESRRRKELGTKDTGRVLRKPPSKTHFRLCISIDILFLSLSPS